MSSTIERKLAAIMFTDIVGFTTIMRKDEGTGVSILQKQESLINPLLDKHKGNLVKRTGDGYLLEFSSSVEAVECAMALQGAIKEYNADNNKLAFHIRIGIHLGDIMIMGDDIIGDGVNIAARIEPMASPDGICMTESVYQSVKSKLDLSPQRISDVDLKHIDDKYTLYKLPESNNIEDSKRSEVKKFNIQISKIENTISRKKIYSLFIKSLLYLSVSFIFGFIGGYFSAGIADVGVKGIFATKFPVSEVLDFLPKITLGIFATSFIITAIFFRKITKLTFNDIRDVETLIDILITQISCDYVGKKNDKIIYIYREYPKILRFFENWIDKTFSAWGKVKVINVVFDGNTITFDGMNYVLFRLIRKIKNYSIKST